MFNTLGYRYAAFHFPYDSVHVVKYVLVLKRRIVASLVHTNKQWHIYISKMSALSSLSAPQTVLCTACKISGCLLPPSKWGQDGRTPESAGGEEKEDGGRHQTGKQRRECLQCSLQGYVLCQSALLKPHRQGILCSP